MHYIEKPDKFLQDIISACYPNYKGRKFRLSGNIPTDLNSYWSGGSRTRYVFYQLDTGKILPVESNHPFFEKDRPSHLEKLPKGIIIVAHAIFCGKDMGITIYANPSDLSKSLPDSPDISENEKIVLKYTSRYKNSYAGQKHCRWREATRETGIDRDAWISAQELLRNKKLLRANNSITPAGRNAINS